VTPVHYFTPNFSKTHFNIIPPSEITFPQRRSGFPTKRKQQHVQREHPNNVTCNSYRYARVNTQPPGPRSRLPSAAHGSRSYINHTHSPIDSSPELNHWTTRTHWTGWTSPVPVSTLARQLKVCSCRKSNPIPQSSTPRPVHYTDSRHLLWWKAATFIASLGRNSRHQSRDLNPVHPK
jgi:hypothetical protein